MCRDELLLAVKNYKVFLATCIKTTTNVENEPSLPVYARSPSLPLYAILIYAEEHKSSKEKMVGAEGKEHNCAPTHSRVN